MSDECECQPETGWTCPSCRREYNAYDEYDDDAAYDYEEVI